MDQKPDWPTGKIPGACEKQANSQLGKLCELNCFNMCIGKAAVQG